jgi:hypothetical protein
VFAKTQPKIIPQGPLDQMDYHKNARTTVWSREQMARRVIEHGCTLAAAAAAANVSAKTASKWVRRYRELGAPGSGIALPAAQPAQTHPAGAGGVGRTAAPQRWTGLRIASRPA